MPNGLGARSLFPPQRYCAHCLVHDRQHLTGVANAFNGTRNQKAASSASATSGAVTTYPQWQDQTAYAISTNVYYNGFFYQTAVAFTLWSSRTAYSVGVVVEFSDSNY